MNRPNLYDFLRRLLKETDDRGKGMVWIGKEEHDWLQEFMLNPDHQIHFKARRVGETRGGDPIYAQDYMIAGDAPDVFCLLTEAMLQNASFASLVVAAHNFYKEHVPGCPECSATVRSVDPAHPDWQFLKHKSV